VNRSVGGLDGEEGLDPIQISYALIVLQHLMRSIQTSVLKAYYYSFHAVLKWLRGKHSSWRFQLPIPGFRPSLAVALAVLFC